MKMQLILVAVISMCSAVFIDDIFPADIGVGLVPFEPINLTEFTSSGTTPTTGGSGENINDLFGSEQLGGRQALSDFSVGGGQIDFGGSVSSVNATADAFSQAFEPQPTIPIIGTYTSGQDDPLIQQDFQADLLSLFN